MTRINIFNLKERNEITFISKFINSSNLYVPESQWGNGNNFSA